MPGFMPMLHSLIALAPYQCSRVAVTKQPVLTRIALVLSRCFEPTILPTMTATGKPGNLSKGMHQHQQCALVLVEPTGFTLTSLSPPYRAAAIYGGVQILSGRICQSQGSQIKNARSCEQGDKRCH